MREFDFYGIVGVIAPGMVVIIGGLVLISPEQYDKIASLASISVGSLGVGLVLAYVAGELLQAIGNGVEKIWWKLWGGMPTDWIRIDKEGILADAQRQQLRAKLCQMLNMPSFELNQDLDSKQWESITGQIYAVVSAAKRTDRVDIFNGIYGLCRGILASLLLLTGYVFTTNLSQWKLALILLILSALALYRMHRFGIRYARELLVQYLSLDSQLGERK